MSHTLVLLFAGVVAAQSADGPKLVRGQELVYRGTYSETSSHDTSQFRRSFEIEALTFVRDVRNGVMDVAFCTTLNTPKSESAGAVRFEMASVDLRGRVRLASGAPTPHFADGPPALECAGFVERPADGPKQWDVIDAPRPTLTWQADGAADVKGIRCLRLHGRQQSPDWDRRTTNRPAWQRIETVWISLETGIVQRLERNLEWRSFGQRDTTLRSRTEYVLHGGISTYPGTLGDDRRFETQHAERFQQELRKLQNPGAKSSPAAYAALASRIDRFMASKPPTPYRAAIEMLRQRADAGRRGEPPPPENP